MPFSKYFIRGLFLVTLVILAFIIFRLCSSSEGNQFSKELKASYKTSIEQAETFKDLQLDSARVYAYRSYEIARKQQNDFEKYTSKLLLSEIRFLQFGASDKLYEKVESYEKWFREHNYYKSSFRANLLRLEIKSFLKGSNNVQNDIDGLIQTAHLSKSNRAKAQAYYFKMDKRDYTRKWEDDVPILDSARMFAQLSKDSVLLGKIRIMSVLPVNGTAESFDSSFLSLKQGLDWKSSSLQILSYEALGMEFAPIQKIDTAILFIKKGIVESTNWGSQVYKLKMYQETVTAYSYSSNLDSIQKYAELGLHITKEVRNIELEHDFLINLGISWFGKGEHSKGVKYIFKALEIAKKQNSEDGIFSTQRLLVGVLIKLKRFDEARKVVKKMLKVLDKKESNYANDITRAGVYYLRARIFLKTKKYESALYFFQKGKDLFNKNGAGGIKKMQLETSILETLLTAKKYDRANAHYHYMKTYYSDSFLDHFDFLFLEGKLFTVLGETNKAIIALEKSLEKSQEKQIRYQICFQLSKLYETKGNFKQALEYNKKGLHIKKEHDAANDQLKLEKIQSKNDLATKEVEIKQLKIDQLEQKNSLIAQENKLQTRTLYLIFLSVLLILLATIAVFIYNRAKQARVREKLKRSALNKERQIELLKAEESQRTIELKNQLFANISHEFRTPLTLIQAPVEELMDRLSKNDQHALQVVKRNADHLLHMVDEILELTRLDAGDATLSKKPFDLHDFLRKLQMNFEPIYKQNKVQLDIDCPEEEFTIFADEYRLKMVLNNLLKNAFHHTPEGGEVTVKIIQNKSKNILELSVFNTGECIDESFLPTIFDRYARSKEKEYSGYGIGLSFCQQIIVLHDGEIKAENVENGVLLSFWIPTAFNKIDVRPEEIQTLYTDDEPKISGERLHKLLIVEDNLEMRNLLKELLFDEYEIILATNGEEGIEMAEENQPDLIISDIMMPKVGGMELTKTLKENFSTSHVPIILLTAKSAGHDRIAGLETGADDYLTKPFSPKELRVRVRNLIEQREKLRKRFSKNVFLIPKEITSNSLDQAFLSKATEIVESNLDNPDFSVEQFCRKLALNRNSVHQKLKSLTGSSASQFIKSIKLKKAATFLADERISIVEVSELSGFNNRQAFNKAFKDQFEMTPSEYRLECLSKEK